MIYYLQNVIKNLLQHIIHKRPCLTTFSKRREESWKFDAQRSIFDELRRVWKCGRIQSFVFDISRNSNRTLCTISTISYFGGVQLLFVCLFFSQDVPTFPILVSFWRTLRYLLFSYYRSLNMVLTSSLSCPTSNLGVWACPCRHSFYYCH